MHRMSVHYHVYLTAFRNSGAEHKNTKMTQTVIINSNVKNPVT